MVTGAASGIGRAMAFEAAGAGMDLVLVDLDAEGLESVRKSILERWPDLVVDCRRVDLTSDEAIDLAFRPRATDQFPRPTRLFHAAGVIVRRPSVADVTPEDWDIQVGVNQKASWFLTRAFAESLAQDGLSGSVVLVSSVSGYLGLISGSWVYAATKGAVTSMVKGFAKTYGAAGIRVNGICPGLVETPMVRGPVEDQELRKLIESHVPIGRTASPAEIARAALFLLSDNASYVVGVNLDVDGGWLRR
jgi:NAD(P)-dependent dehydrogenase (short-subunit alcohol dehydrogenase family)